MWMVIPLPECKTSGCDEPLEVVTTWTPTAPDVMAYDWEVYFQAEQVDTEVIPINANAQNGVKPDV
jgi:hypothetical protein